MKVYVLCGHVEKEYFQVLAVYKTKEKAEAAQKVAEDEFVFEAYDIQVVELIE